MNAVMSVVYGDVPGFPPGSAVAAIQATITGAVTPAVSQSVSPGTASITFTSVPADTYSFSVAAVDSAGNTFGTPFTGTFTVGAASTVTLSLPVSATVAVA